MPDSDEPARYTPTAIALHWIIAFAVIAQITLGWGMQEVLRGPISSRANAFNLHKSIGLTILVLMAIRLAWRATHRPPALPPMPAWQARAAHINHWLLYACLLVQPLSGYIGSAASGYPVRYFGMLLPAWTAKNVALKELLSVVHLVNSWILLSAVALHVGAALKHHFIDRDGMLRRMWVARAG